MSPFDQGYNAALTGAECPFPAPSPDHSAWWDGHEQAWLDIVAGY